MQTVTVHLSPEAAAWLRQQSRETLTWATRQVSDARDIHTSMAAGKHAAMASQAVEALDAALDAQAVAA